jgi:2-keto-4-pentenoate hydratase/2-oxohepta-3-ene-1,7-dioic acid hydratase in catechol pathway
MKLATYTHREIVRIGIVHDDDARVFDLRSAASRAGVNESIFQSMLTLMDAGPDGLTLASDIFSTHGDDGMCSIELEEVQLLAPVPVPRQMRDGMLFPEHIRQSAAGMQRVIARMAGKTPTEAPAPLGEVPRVFVERPIYFFTNRYAVGGPESTVNWPSYSAIMDYEIELGIFIGRGGTNIPLEEARQHIFGYTIFNDFSARDQQFRETVARQGPSKGKSFNGSNVIGPWIVTRDEIPDPYNLAMTVRVNGEVRVSGTSSGMLHSFEDFITYVSRDETLHAGEFLASGTMGGGSGLEQDRFLEDGDTIELEIEKIGVLRNIVRKQPSQQ